MNIREQAVKTLLRIEKDGAYSNLETRAVLKRFEVKAEDRGLYLNLVYGVLQKKLWLDAVLNCYVKKGVAKLDAEVRIILELALYQIYELDRVPDYAAVNEAVKITTRLKPRAKGFVNGVLRNVLRHREQAALVTEHIKQPKKRLSVATSVPEWIVDKYIETFGAQKAEAVLNQMHQKPPFAIRVNTLKTTRAHLQQQLETKGIETEQGTLNPDALLLKNVDAFSGKIEADPLYQDGFFTIQDQGAMLTAALLAPLPGERVLDMCAAPGGKTTHLAQLMDNTGLISARDVSEGRLALIDETAKRLGVTIIQTQAADASVCQPEEEGAWDRILLDAPCSGLGIIRRKPEIRYTMQASACAELAIIQEKMLENAVQALKPGGVLVYSTCTINREENEGQIEKLLKKMPEMMLDPTAASMLYTTPLEEGCDCFFMARLIKKSC